MFKRNIYIIVKFEKNTIFVIYYKSIHTIRPTTNIYMDFHHKIKRKGNTDKCYRSSWVQMHIGVSAIDVQTTLLSEMFFGLFLDWKLDAKQRY